MNERDSVLVGVAYENGYNAALAAVWAGIDKRFPDSDSPMWLALILARATIAAKATNPSPSTVNGQIDAPETGK